MHFQVYHVSFGIIRQISQMKRFYTFLGTKFMRRKTNYAECKTVKLIMLINSSNSWHARVNLNSQRDRVFQRFNPVRRQAIGTDQRLQCAEKSINPNSGVAYLSCPSIVDVLPS